MSFIFREARPTELGAILEIERSTPDLPHWPGVEYEGYVCGPKTADRLLLVVERAGIALGFAAAKLSASISGVAELESLVVVPGVRRAGLGRELCRYVIAWCRERERDTLELEVRSRNFAAIALYQTLGFSVIRRRSRYYVDPLDDALLMSLAL